MEISLQDVHQPQHQHWRVHVRPIHFLFIHHSTNWSPCPCSNSMHITLNSQHFDLNYWIFSQELIAMHQSPFHQFCILSRTCYNLKLFSYFFAFCRYCFNVKFPLRSHIKFIQADVIHGKKSEFCFGKMSFLLLIQLHGIFPLILFCSVFVLYVHVLINNH